MPARAPPDRDAVPIYCYRCGGCDCLTDAFAPVSNIPDRVVCEHCGSKETHRVISSVAYHASQSSRTARLDPKYEKMVDNAMKKSASADENRLIDRMQRRTAEKKQ